MRKKEGFEAEKLLVLPKQLVNVLIEHPIAQMLFVTDIGYFPRAKYHYRERTDGSESHILIFCVSGEGWVQAGNTERRAVKKYDLIILPPKLPHMYEASETDPWSIYWIHFQGKLASHYFETLPLSNWMMQVSANSAVRLIDLFTPIFELLSEKSYSTLHCLYANIQLQQMLGLLSLQIPTDRDVKSNGYVEQSIEYMKRHIKENLTLAELAEQTNLSRSHYLAVFKRVTSTSPMNYFVNLKIRQACTYLDLTDWSIKEISGELGFQDSLYFSRAFRKIMGQSPSAYREKKKG